MTSRRSQFSHHLAASLHIPKELAQLSCSTESQKEFFVSQSIFVSDASHVAHGGESGGFRIVLVQFDPCAIAQELARAYARA